MRCRHLSDIFIRIYLCIENHRPRESYSANDEGFNALLETLTDQQNAQNENTTEKHEAQIQLAQQHAKQPRMALLSQWGQLSPLIFEKIF